MLDVHPPHTPTHTWRDFLLHIATIVVGLIIAVALEQTVEFFHHQHQAHEARELLFQEMDANRQAVAENVYSLRLHEKHLLAALTVLEHLRSHTAQPDDAFITYRSWLPLSTAAWKTVRDGGAAQYLSPSEQARFDLSNEDAALFMTNSLAASVAIGRATMLINVDRLDVNPDLSTGSREDRMGLNGDEAAERAYASKSPRVDQIHLTPKQIDDLEQAIQSSLFDDQVLLNTCKNLRTRYDTFIPPHQ
jgi:hypothetical protein